MDIKNLYADVVNKRAGYFDFSKGYLGKWEIALDLEDDEIDEFYPMMNYIYPLPNDFENDMVDRFGDNWRSKIKDELISMTIVYMIDDGEYYLALTGGGMDMSWDICKTYINLGYLPPLEFCDLPDFAGMDYKKNREIVEACLRSCEIADYNIEHIKNKLEGMR